MCSRTATALGQIGAPEAVPHLIKALSDSDDSVRSEAATALGQLANVCSDSGKLKEIASKLWWRLTDDEWVARNACDSIEKVATQQSKLEVEELPFDNPLISPYAEPPSDRIRYSRKILIAIAIAMSTIIVQVSTSILTEQIKQQVSIGYKGLLVLIVAMVILIAFIWILQIFEKQSENEKNKER